MKVHQHQNKIIEVTMNYFLRDVPESVQLAITPTEQSFETMDDLLNIAAVKSFKEMEGFEFFAMSGKSLVAIFDDGYKWWPVGFISDPASLDLPEWDKGKYRFELGGQIIEVNGSKVLSTCGDEITLLDGSVGRRIRDVNSP